MDEELVRDLVQVNEARVSFCRFLSSLYLYELTQEQIDALAHLDYEDDGSLVAQGYARVVEYLRHRNSGTRQELAVDYAHTFLGAGSYEEVQAPPYESVYTSKAQIMMQDARDKALKYYRAEELDLPEDNTTPEDHLGFELQFMAELALRANDAVRAGDVEGVCALVNRQRGFLRFHLENWVGDLCDAIDRSCHTEFYHAVALLTRGYLASERSTLDALAAELRIPGEEDELKPTWMEGDYIGDDDVPFAELSILTRAREEAERLGAIGPKHL